MITLTRRGGLWWYRLRLSNGLDVRRSTGEAEKSKAEIATLQAITSLNPDGQKQSRKAAPPLSVFQTQYLEWAEARFTRATIERTRFAFLALKRFLSGEDRIPTCQEGELFLQARVKQVKPVSADGDIRHLRAAFSVGFKQGWVPENPFHDVALLRLPKRERPVLTPEEMRRVLHASKVVGKDIEIACHLAGLAGLRKGEIEACCWEWIDWEERTLRISCDQSFTPKGKRGRTVPVHPMLIESLMRHRRNSGRIISTDCVSRKAWTRVQSMAKVRVPFHSLRHSAASLWANNGVPAFMIQSWLGHASITTTQGYVHTACQAYDDRIAFALPEAIPDQKKEA